MTAQQTAYVGQDVVVVINVTDSTGAHVAATGVDGSRLGSHPSALPNVTPLATGQYEIRFANLTPPLEEGDRIVCDVKGNIGGTPWSDYAVPVVVVAEGKGTDNALQKDVEYTMTHTASGDTAPTIFVS